MSIRKKIIGTMIFLSLSLFLWGQCPDDLNVQQALHTQDVKTLQATAKELENCPQLQDSLALVYHYLGIFLYQTQLDSAIFYAEQSLKIRKTLFGNEPNLVLGKSYNNLGVFLGIAKRSLLGKKYLSSAIDIYKKIKIPARVTKSQFELAKIYIDEGEYELAKTILEHLATATQQLKQERLYALVFIEQGRMLTDLGNYAKAVGQLELAKNKFDEYYFPKDKAACRVNLGKSFFYLEKYDEAIDNFKEAIAIYQELGNCDEVAKNYNNLGRTYQKNNNLNLAFQTLQEGVKMAQSCHSKEMLAQGYDHLGLFFLEKKEYQKALYFFQKTIKILVPNFLPNNDIQNPTTQNIALAFDPIYLFGYLGDKAKVLHLLANKENNSTYLASALQLYQLGDALIDQLRKEHQDQDTKLFWRKQAIPFYENAIGTCYQMQDVENAFFFFEKSKAILLLEAMQTSGALQMIPDSIRNEFQVLQRKLLQTKESLEQATTVQKEIITKNLVELQQKLETKTEQLAEVYPKYFDIKYGTNTRSLADVQKEFSASKEKTGVHFFYGKKNIYALTINAKNSKLYQLGATPTIETEIKNFLSFFQKSSAIENAPADFLQQAQNIYAILLAPLSLGTQEELIIFPDGALAYLPFEALVTAPSEEIGAADYLIKKHIIHYGYSATIFSKQNKNQTKLLHHGIAAFAPFADASAGAAYATLDFSKDELGEISQELEGVFLKNKEATKQAFLSKIKDVSVLHLSTHAFSSPTESKPRIVFADTSLFLSELYGLDISANLVVLSACQSNIGKLSQGEGVMSLGRGFTFAGAKSLVSSLWNVNAVATSNILSDFYKKIENNTPKYQALHAAKKAYLENEKIPSYERSPYYWAGLIYYGDDGGVVLQKKTSNFLFVKVLLFGLVLLAGFYFSRGRGVTASSGNTS